MATYFAEIDKDNIIKRVIVADREFINSGKVGDPKKWVETFMDGNVRKNYAGIGHSYDNSLDAFISKKQFDSWILDEEKAQWRAPVEKPTDGMGYIWNEKDGKWDLIIDKIISI